MESMSSMLARRLHTFLLRSRRFGLRAFHTDCAADKLDDPPLDLVAVGGEEHAGTVLFVGARVLFTLGDVAGGFD